MGKRFLLVGSERSGTTLLRLMLDSHPDISCMFDSNFMFAPHPTVRRRGTAAYQHLLNDDWHFRNSGLTFPDSAADHAAVIDDFFSQRKNTTGKSIIGATIHRGFDWIPTLLGDTKVIHLVRDGRAVASSIVQMGWVGNTYFGGRRWASTMATIAKFRAKIPAENWINVNYESLLHDVEGQLARLSTFLGTEYDEKMLEYSGDSTYEPPDPKNADRWRQKMPPCDIYYAEIGAGEWLVRCGYERVFPPAEISGIERAFLALDHRIRRVLFNCQRYGTYLVFARRLLTLLGVSCPTLHTRFDAIHSAHVK